MWGAADPVWLSPLIELHTTHLCTPIVDSLLSSALDGFHDKITKGADITKYTGSTTGTSRDNTLCSAYSPITWQVDRKCHLISASSFDKMCADMKSQKDDMTHDLYPHGSRPLVMHTLAANNQVDR